MVCPVAQVSIPNPGSSSSSVGGAAAWDVPRVQDQAAVPRLGQIAGGEQAVVPGARHHDIRVSSLMIRLSSPAVLQTICR